jgi:hypothetical protein
VTKREMSDKKIGYLQVRAGVFLYFIGFFVFYLCSEGRL